MAIENHNFQSVNYHISSINEPFFSGKNIKIMKLHIGVIGVAECRGNSPTPFPWKIALFNAFPMDFQFPMTKVLVPQCAWHHLITEVVALPGCLEGPAPMVTGKSKTRKKQRQIKLGRIVVKEVPSGYVKIAIENYHL